jgi:hypothetical protein
MGEGLAVQGFQVCYLRCHLVVGVLSILQGAQLGLTQLRWLHSLASNIIRRLLIFLINSLQL